MKENLPWLHKVMQNMEHIDIHTNVAEQYNSMVLYMWPV